MEPRSGLIYFVVHLTGDWRFALSNHFEVAFGLEFLLPMPITRDLQYDEHYFRLRSTELPGQNPQSALVGPNLNRA